MTEAETVPVLLAPVPPSAVPGVVHAAPTVPDGVQPAPERAAVGAALAARAAEVAAAVVGHWRRRSPDTDVSLLDEVTGHITWTCTLGVQLIAGYLRTGQDLHAAQRQDLAAAAELSVRNTISLTDHARNYLVWRDVLLAVADEECVRLGAGDPLRAELAVVVRRSCDAGLIRMVGEYDVQRADLTGRLDAERSKLARLALQDPLTGLANRAVFMDRLTHAVRRRPRCAERAVVLFLDLDGFKAVNDRLGHAAGDSLLQQVAGHLTGLVRPADTVARLGGDEFAVLCEDLADDAEVEQLVQRIVAGVGACCPQADLPVSVSVGMALAPVGADPDRVLAEADVAMYLVKRRHRA